MSEAGIGIGIVCTAFEQTSSKGWLAKRGRGREDGDLEVCIVGVVIASESSDVRIGSENGLSSLCACICMYVCR